MPRARVNAGAYYGAEPGYQGTPGVGSRAGCAAQRVGHTQEISDFPPGDDHGRHREDDRAGLNPRFQQAKLDARDLGRANSQVRDEAASAPAGAAGLPLLDSPELVQVGVQRSDRLLQRMLLGHQRRQLCAGQALGAGTAGTAAGRRAQSQDLRAGRKRRPRTRITSRRVAIQLINPARIMRTARPGQRQPSRVALLVVVPSATWYTRE